MEEHGFSVRYGTAMAEHGFSAFRITTAEAHGYKYKRGRNAFELGNDR